MFRAFSFAPNYSSSILGCILEKDNLNPQNIILLFAQRTGCMPLFQRNLQKFHLLRRLQASFQHLHKRTNLRPSLFLIWYMLYFAKRPDSSQQKSSSAQNGHNSNHLCLSKGLSEQLKYSTNWFSTKQGYQHLWWPANYNHLLYSEFHHMLQSEILDLKIHCCLMFNYNLDKSNFAGCFGHASRKLQMRIKK